MNKWSWKYYLFSPSQLASLVSKYCFLVLFWLNPFSFPLFLWIEGYHKEIKSETELKTGEDQVRKRELQQMHNTRGGAWQNWGPKSYDWSSVFMGVDVSRIWNSVLNPDISFNLFIFKKYFYIFILPCSKNDLRPPVIWLVVTRTLSLTKPHLGLLSPVLAKAHPDKPVYQESPPSFFFF